jgi:hypothetical protein
MLHPPPGLKGLNSECQICMIYCLESWTQISETVSVLNVVESCGFGWLTEEHPGSPSMHLSWGAYHLKTKTGVPSGPTAPSSAIWLKDVRPCCRGTQIISWGFSVSEVCIIGPSCQLSWKFRIRWFFLHFTFHRLLGTALAREEHPDRLWGSCSFLLSQYMW